MSLAFSVAVMSLFAGEDALSVSGIDCDVPGMVAHDPEITVTTTIRLRNIGTAAIDVAARRWKATRTRALPYQTDPSAIWSVDVTDVEEVCDGRLATDLAPLPAKGTAQVALACRPGRFGHFSLHLEGPGGWQRIGGFAIVPPPPSDRNRSPFIAGGPHGFERRGDLAWMPTLARLGAGWVRVGFAPRRTDDGTLDWSAADTAVAALRKNGLRVIMDFETPPGCEIPRLGGQPVWYAKSKANLIPRREDLPAFEAYARTFLDRYRDTVRGVFCRNEPWEGGSISNYHASNRYYRDWHAALFRAASATDPGIAVLANDQVTNLEDVFLGDPAALATVTHTSHHTGFNDNRGAVQSAVLGKPAWETEDWSSHSDSYVIANLARKLAGGFATSNPIESCFWTAGRGGPRYPSATAQAVGVFLHMTAGLRFLREPWPERLPHVLVFADDAGGHRAVVFGRIKAYGYNWRKGDGDMAWPQVTADGVWRLPDPKRSLAVHDISGNPVPRGADGGVALPLNEEPIYLVSSAGLDDLLARLAAARVEHGGPALSLGLLDFTRRPANTPPVRVRLRNLGNHADSIRVAAIPPDGWRMAEPVSAVELAAGEERLVELPVAAAAARPGNTYPFTITATSSSGALTVREELHVCVIPRATITVDGDLSDWGPNTAPVLLTGGMARPDGFETYIFPFAELQASDARGIFARFATAWDAQHFYVMAEVNDPTAVCRPAERGGIPFLMHDEPLQDLYWRKPQFRGAVGDGLKLAIDQHRPGAKSDPLIPAAWQRRIDTRYQRLSADYEYDLYPGAVQELVESYASVRDRHLATLASAKDKTAVRMPGAAVRQVGDPVPEVWRLMAPGVPRSNRYPFQQPTLRDQGLVDGARLAIRREGSTWRYEAAIPWSELAEVAPVAGREIRLSWYVLNDGRRVLGWTSDRTICLGARQTLHPTWQAAEAIETVWGFE